MAQNPYIAGNPVGNTGSFVGRADVKREVLRVLKKSNQNTLVLFGQRRIGKTSILQYLEANLSNDKLYHPVYFDLQDKASYSLSRVLKELAGSISNALGIDLPDLGRNAEKSFRQTWLPNVLNSLEEKHSIVMLFDEFDVISEPKQDQAVAAFFPYLRTLLSLDPDRLQFIFVIGRNIDDVGSIALSLFKGTPSYSVSLLSRDDATALIELAEKNKLLSWNKKAVAKILELTNGHPFLTQQICSQIFEDAYEKEPKNIPQISLADVENAIPKVLNMSGSSLEWLWDGLPPAGKVVASALAKAGREPITQDQLMSILKESGVRVVIPELMDAPMLLQKWDLIQPADGGYVFRVELLRQWIVAHKPLKSQINELDQLLPIAQGLYQAAVGFYQEGQFDNAIDYLRKATTKNPNHLRANELLAEILISQNNLEEAQAILERLLEYHPAVARPQLIEVLLSRASSEQDDNEKLIFYEKTLELERDQREALSGKQRIWKRRADEVLEVGDYAKAVEAYKRAGLADEAQSVEIIIHEKELKNGLQQLSDLEKEGKYSAAMELIKSLSGQFPQEHEWNTDLERLEQNNRIAESYQRALGAIQSKDMKTACDLLLEVVEQNPEYEEASRYLHLAITGVDVEERSRKLRRFSFAIIGLIILLFFMSTMMLREYRTSNTLDTTVQTMRANVKSTEEFLTKKSYNITSTSIAIKETMIAQEKTAMIEAKAATSQANVTSTYLANATLTALAQRKISDVTINSLSKLRYWTFSQKVNAIDFSPSSEYLVAGLSDGNLYIWKLNDFQLPNETKVPKQESAINTVAFSPNGDFIASGYGDGKILIWSVSNEPSGEPSVSLFNTLGKHTRSIKKIVFSPDGEYLASISDDDTAFVWKINGWSPDELDFSDVTKNYSSATFDISDVDFSSDGKQLAVSVNWKYSDAVEIDCPYAPADTSNNCHSIIYVFRSPDWQVDINKPFDRYRIYSLRFSLNNPMLFFDATDEAIHSFSLSELSEQKTISEYTQHSCPFDVSFSGKHLISCANSLVFWHIPVPVKGAISVRSPSSSNSQNIALSSDQMFIASSYNSNVTLYGIPYVP